jgi:predicted O-linked N-acetylglucosamine transferase (SPINDLY family)
MNLGKLKALPVTTPSRKGFDIGREFARGQAYHRFGDLAEAQAAYRRVLKKSPNHFDALHMLGVCEHLSGNSEAAVRLLNRALLVDPQSVAARCDLAVLLIVLRRLDEALVSCDRAIAVKPDFVVAYYHRGNVLMGLRRFADAVASFDQVIALDPHHADALNNRGNALHELGKFAEAVASYDLAVTLKPSHALALANRGAAFKELRQAVRAISDFDAALALAPDQANSWTNRGGVLLFLGRRDEALASYDKALSINPKLSEAWLGRANVLMLNSRVADALAACHNALAIEPRSALALAQIGQCHARLGDAETAVSFYDRALAIKPNDEAALTNRIFALDFSEASGFGQHQAARSEWWRQIGSNISARHPPQHENDRDPTRRIVLGYVSADFRKHSAAFTFRPVLENHDKARFEVICYSGYPTEDAVTASFRNVADQWRDASQWSNDQLRDCIRADKVDILIDLSGHTSGNRLRVFAGKPAPIQVTAWGHATGTGLPTIDYLFSDSVAIPAEFRHLFAEQIHDLPCLIIVEPPPAELRWLEPPMASNGYVTYGALNRISKISDAAVAVWAKILLSDVTSRLLIKHRLLDDASVRRLLLERFARHGIPSERIAFEGSTSREVHLATYQRVDICLDPFPHGGGVTTWEALYMGVPVVAQLGNGVAARAAGAILSSVGMADWVAADDDQYVAIALGATADRLGTIRSELSSRIECRCSPAEYTRTVEAAYRTMWQKYCGARPNLAGADRQSEADSRT